MTTDEPTAELPHPMQVPTLATATRPTHCAAASTYAPGSPLEHFLLTLRSLLEFTVISLFAVTFVVQPFRIPSESMVPTLHVGDFLLVDKQSFAPEGIWTRLLPPTTPARNDLAVFHFPVDPSLHLVKRIVAVPGDRVRLRAGRLWINGAPATDPFAFRSATETNDFRDNFPSLREVDPNLEPAWWRTLHRIVQGEMTGGSEITVPPDSYFVLGDNRNNSEDSRYWGFVRRADLVGRPFVVYFSLPPAEALEGAERRWWDRVRATFAGRWLR